MTAAKCLAVPCIPTRGAVLITRHPQGLLGDTTGRDYSAKLRLFNAFASPELRRAVASLHLSRGMQVLDAGCGTGEALGWLCEHVAPDGRVWGIDLSAAHAKQAHAANSAGIGVAQAEILKPPFAAGTFDLIWSVNTLNHLADPLEGVRALKPLLRAGGRLALGQSSFLPDMYFAWDSRLERTTNEAVRQHYRDRYGLTERDLCAVRALVGTVRRAGLQNVQASTFVIERLSPLAAADRDYLMSAIFQGTFGDKVRPYMRPEDFQELSALCDPGSAACALQRPDFHFLQTFTLVCGEGE